MRRTRRRPGIGMEEPYCAEYAESLVVTDIAGESRSSGAMYKMYKPKGDFVLVFLVLALAVFGVIMVFSASYYDNMVSGKSAYSFLLNGALWATAGLFLMFLLSFVSYKVYFGLAPLVLIVSLCLLCLLFTPLGMDINSATRWIEVGPLTFMPGELAKVAIISFFAWYYSKIDKKAIKSFKGFLPAAILMAVFVALIYKQPNLSTAVIIALIAIAMMFLGGARLFHILLIVVGGGTVLAVSVFTKQGEHLSRISGYLDPFSDPQGNFYQTVQGLLALGAGGVTGAGPGRGVQKALYLPAASNDYIFAVIGEELGFIGCILLLLVFLMLIWRCVHISMNAPDRFSMLLGSGITVMLALQVILNIAVVTNLFPPTGVTLPFISYGGNAMLLFMGSMGIMYHISKYPEVAASRENQRLIRPRPEKAASSSERKTGASTFETYEEPEKAVAAYESGRGGYGYGRKGHEIYEPPPAGYEECIYVSENDGYSRNTREHTAVGRGKSR